jgi:hypothetical protein
MRNKSEPTRAKDVEHPFAHLGGIVDPKASGSRELDSLSTEELRECLKRFKEKIEWIEARLRYLTAVIGALGPIPQKQEWIVERKTTATSDFRELESLSIGELWESHTQLKAEIERVETRLIMVAICVLGQIPEHQQKCVAQRLIGVAHSYNLCLALERTHPTLGGRSQILQKVADSSGRLLKALGIDDPAYIARGLAGGMPGGLGLLLPDLYTIGVQRRGSTETADIGSGVKNMLMLLSDLHEVAARAARELGGGVPKGHGGKRRDGPGAFRVLVVQIIEIYRDVRDRHPESGPPPRFNSPLIDFIRACLRAIDPKLAGAESTTNEAIRGHLNYWLKWKRTVEQAG